MLFFLFFHFLLSCRDKALHVGSRPMRFHSFVFRWFVTYYDWVVKASVFWTCCETPFARIVWLLLLWIWRVQIETGVEEGSEWMVKHLSAHGKECLAFLVVGVDRILTFVVQHWNGLGFFLVISVGRFWSGSFWLFLFENVFLVLVRC